MPKLQKPFASLVVRVPSGCELARAQQLLQEHGVLTVSADTLRNQLIVRYDPSLVSGTRVRRRALELKAAAWKEAPLLHAWPFVSRQLSLLSLLFR